MEGGFIKIHRKLLDWEWYSDSLTKSVFIHLLLTANYKLKRWKGLVIERGQVLVSARSLGEALEIDPHTAMKCLKNLESTGEITLQKSNKFGTLVTIRNYHQYQVDTDLSVCLDNTPNNTLNNTPSNTPSNTPNNTDIRKKRKKRNINNTVVPTTEVEVTAAQQKRFVKPTIEEVSAYIAEKSYNVDAEVWWNFYESKGWKVGNAPMKNWKAAVATWAKNRGGYGQSNSTASNGKRNAYEEVCNYAINRMRQAASGTSPKSIPDELPF